MMPLRAHLVPFILFFVSAVHNADDPEYSILKQRIARRMVKVGCPPVCCDGPSERFCGALGAVLKDVPLHLVAIPGGCDSGQHEPGRHHQDR